MLHAQRAAPDPNAAPRLLERKGWFAPEANPAAAADQRLFIDMVPAPFTGQGIATDPVTGGLIGIDRGKKRIILAEFAAK